MTEATEHTCMQGLEGKPQSKCGGGGCPSRGCVHLPLDTVLSHWEKNISCLTRMHSRHRGLGMVGELQLVPVPGTWGCCEGDKRL